MSSSEELFKNLNTKVEAEVANTQPTNPPEPEDTSFDNEPEIQKPDEMSVLKERARKLNISFSNNIGLDTLRDKVNNAVKGVNENTEEVSNNITNPKKVINTRSQIRREQLRLVRVRITNMDPKKKDLDGEIFTIANEIVGTVRKFVPYGDKSENGYHLEYCLYRHLLSRKFLDIKVIKGKENEPVQRWVREFAIELLPDLGQEGLNKLKAAQNARGTFNIED